jgi:hypothetical protein
VLRGFVAAAFAATSVGMMAGSASAGSSVDSTTANVGVNSSIAVTGLTPSFTLNGAPGATVTRVGAVTFKVETNNLAGYMVSVQPTTLSLTPPVHDPVNADSIPITALSVRETGTSGYVPFSTTSTERRVHVQPTRSLPGGDTLSTDYEIAIPFVNQDTYSATLNYVATTL